MSKINEFKNKLSELNSEFLNTIINSDDLTKYEKLSEIRLNNLMPIDNWIQHVFRKYEIKLEQLVKEKTGRDHCITDDIFHSNNYQRHEIVYFDDVIQGYTEDLEEGELITVVTNRTTDDFIEITAEEFINCIYDFVMENKIIGFEIDW